MWFTNSYHARLVKSCWLKIKDENSLKLAYFCIQSNLRLWQPPISDRLSSPLRVNIKNILERANSSFQEHNVEDCKYRSRYFTWPLNALKKAVTQKRQLIYTAIKRPFLKIFLTFTCSIKDALYLLEYWPKTYITKCSTLVPGPFPFPRHGKEKALGTRLIVCC